MRGKEQCVIFLLTAFLGCNNMIIAQQPGNDFCANAQELCPNQFVFASTDQATIDNCPTCSDFGVFNFSFMIEFELLVPQINRTVNVVNYPNMVFS